MAGFIKQLKRAKTLTGGNVTEQLFTVIKNASAEMVEMNRKQINVDSQDIYGKAIGYYSKATELITGGAKAKGEPFTGKDTGDWLSKFYVTVLNDVFYFGSSDPKTDDINDSPHWLSNSLYGLTDENLKIMIDKKFKPFIINHFRKELGL